MYRTTERVVVVVAAAAFVAACGGESDESGPSTSAQPSQPSVAAAQTSSPPVPTAPATGATMGEVSEDARLLMYANGLMLMTSSREEMVAFFSENIPESEVESCMNAAGFEYVPEQSPEERVAEDVRYSVSAEEYAATYGLGIAGWELGVIPSLAPPRNQAAVWSMTASEREAYEASLGQCLGGFDPERRVWSNAVTIAVEQFRPVVEADSRVVEALATWQSCMSVAGYDFDTPMQMRESFYARMGQAESLEAIFADEVRVAVANVPCEADYEATRRKVISDRFAEFKAFFDAARTSGAAPDGNG